jgi:hypothetical protein
MCRNSAHNYLHEKNLFLARSIEVFAQVFLGEFIELDLGREGWLAEFSGVGFIRR